MSDQNIIVFPHNEVTEIFRAAIKKSAPNPHAAENYQLPDWQLIAVTQVFDLGVAAGQADANENWLTKKTRDETFIERLDNGKSVNCTTSIFALGGATRTVIAQRVIPRGSTACHDEIPLRSGI